MFQGSFQNEIIETPKEDSFKMLKNIEIKPRPSEK